jgi:hypothetical protein
MGEIESVRRIEREQEFDVDSITSLTIRCSFCSAEIRKDLPKGEVPVPRGTGGRIANELRAEAKALGWKAFWSAGKSVTLNLCSDHARAFNEMEIIK